LRFIVLAIGGLEAVASLGVIVLFMSGSPDPLGAAIARGIVALIAIPLIACVLPALILGWYRKWLPFALALELLGPMAFLMVMGDLGP
jgi:hypothetical protein